MKNFSLFALTLLMVLAMTVTTAAENDTDAIGIIIDGKVLDLDTAPVIRSNRTLVPLRGVFEELGANVDWNQETGQAIIKSDTIEVLLTADTSGVLVNGQLHSLDAPATLMDDRLLIPVRFVAESLGHEVGWDADSRSVLITTSHAGPVSPDDGDLPTIGSRENLIQLLKYNDDLNNYIDYRFMEVDLVWEVEEAMDDAGGLTPDNALTEEATAAPAIEKSADYSDTNTQVEGVDEGDMIKTNGTIITFISGDNVKIIDPDPASPSLLSEITIDSSRGYISSLYLTDDRLVMLGTAYVSYGMPEPIMPESKLIAPSYYDTPNTFFLAYDISDPSSPELLMDMDFEGHYVSSRLVGDDFYMVTDKSLNYWSIDTLSDYEIQPKFADNISGQATVITYEDIRYFPDYVAPSVMMTVGIDLKTEAADVSAYLGRGETVYATADHLYLGFTHYEYDTTQLNTLIYVPNYTKTTSLYRFGLKNGAISYEDKGSVPGSVLNQFSLDEYNGHLRIATTRGEMWDDSNISKNNLYILDGDMTLVGSLTGLAEGERIYSTRFRGDRVYMVTYRQVDPFFVIDASNPTAPEVLGQLKIPGFSTYMHILDENHVLGFGTETDESGEWVTAGGLKISLFDVTDPKNPVESKKEVIGLAGTYSEIQNNHKALMISLTKGLMGFPISVSSNTPYSRDFNGAYVYDLSTDDFSYRGSVSHKASDSMYYDYANSISRLLYIGDYLYSFSESKMGVSELDSLNSVGELIFE